MTSTRGFLSAFAACHLLSRVKHPSRIDTIEKVAAASLGIADSEIAGYVDSTEMNYDSFCDDISKIVNEYPVHNDQHLRALRAAVIAKAKGQL
jgi:hypothetical protein